MDEHIEERVPIVPKPRKQDERFEFHPRLFLVLLLIIFTIGGGVYFAVLFGNQVVFAPIENQQRWHYEGAYQILVQTTTAFLCYIAVYFLLSFACAGTDNNKVRWPWFLFGWYFLFWVFDMLALGLDWYFLFKSNSANQFEILPLKATYTDGYSKALAAVLAAMQGLKVLFMVLGTIAFVIPAAEMQAYEDSNQENIRTDEDIDKHDREIATQMREAKRKNADAQFRTSNVTKMQGFNINGSAACDFQPDTRLRRSFLDLWKLLAWEPVDKIAPLRQLVVVSVLCSVITASYPLCVFFPVTWPIFVCNVVLIAYVPIEAFWTGKKHPAMICLVACVYFVTLPSFLTETLLFVLSLVSQASSSELQTTLTTIVVISFQLVGQIMYRLINLLLSYSPHFKNRVQLPFFFLFAIFKALMIKTIMFTAGDVLSPTFWLVFLVDFISTATESSEWFTRWFTAVVNAISYYSLFVFVKEEDKEQYKMEYEQKDWRAPWSKNQRDQYRALWCQKAFCQLLSLVLVPMLLGFDYVIYHDQSVLLRFAKQQFPNNLSIALYFIINFALFFGAPLCAWVIDALALRQSKEEIRNDDNECQPLEWEFWQCSLWYAASLLLAIVVCLVHFYERVKLINP